SPRARRRRRPPGRLRAPAGMRTASLDPDAARERGSLVCGTGALGPPPAELAWALILALTRHVPAEDRAMRDGGWQHTIGPELAGRRLGIVGLGRLGARMAAIARAFEMEPVAWSQNLTAERAVDAGAELV